MASEWANKKYDSLHESRPYHDGRFENWSDKRSERYPFHARDGVDIGVADRDLNPDDYFLGKPTEVSPEALQGFSQ